MHDADDLLIFTENLVRDKTGKDLSDIQRRLLLATFRGVKKSYEELAKDYNYSSRYLQQEIAPKLWQLLSDALACQVSKSNARVLLEQQMQDRETEASLSPSASLALMVDPPSSELTTPALKKSKTEARQFDLEKERILLVDDKPENLALLTHLLEEEEYEVQQAINGITGLRVATSTLPDLILLDISMPDLDGYSVCKRIRDDPETQHIPIIFISALDEAWDKVKAFSVGGNDFIAKPFKTIEVIARVRNQLQFRRLQLTLQEKERQLEEALQTIETLRNALRGVKP